MKNTKKMIRSLILFVLLIIITFTVILKNANLMDIVNAVQNVKIEFIIIAIIAMGLYFVCDAINIGRTLKTLNEKSSFWRNLKYSLIGFFFSSITPAASGGQPMQVYYMHKDHIKVANSTLSLLINLTCMQVVTISLALVSLFFNYQYMNVGLTWFFIIGITLNAFALTLLLISIYRDISSLLEDEYITSLEDIDEEDDSLVVSPLLFIRLNKMIIVMDATTSKVTSTVINIIFRFFFI